MKPTDTSVTTTTPTIEIDARPLAQVEREFVFAEDGRVSLAKGAKVSAGEFALLIADREKNGDKAKTQARWAFFEASRLPNGKEVQDAICKRLSEMLTPSALNNLKSEARTLCPLVIEHGFKAPLTTLKNVMGALPKDANGNRVVPPKSKRNPLLKELIPALEAGTISQSGVNKLRAKHEKPNQNGAQSAPAKGNAASRLTDSEKALAGVTLSLKSAAIVLDAHRAEGDVRTAIINLVCDLGRKLGLDVSVPGAKVVPSAPAPAPKAAAAPATAGGK